MTRVRSIAKLYADARQWLAEDWRHVEESLGGQIEALRGKRALVVGAAGFLGFNLLHFFSYINENRSEDPPMKIVAVDNYLRGHPRWIVELARSDSNIELRRFDITQPWNEGDCAFDFIIYGASVASPTFYRRYPLETIDANVSGLRRMLELARWTRCESVLYFSSSEIYGDPPPNEIPTKEGYRGNVACIGPRACYDESKRLGETLCYLYARQYEVPVKIVRPFNNYGPGLRLTDGRVIPDFIRSILADRDIMLHSDGSPMRTFCYSSDALTGYLLALLSPYNGEPFNIGSDTPEISMRDLAHVLLRIAGSKRRVTQVPSQESDYLTDNPARRCPDISKARAMLGFSPRIGLEAGLTRMLEWHRQFAPLDELMDT